MPSVSTIIPVFNGAETVGAAIESALAQGFDHQEIIVVNDGSTDDTPKVLAAYPDSIRVIHQSNQGQSAARNAGVAIARGDYISFLDADDEWAGDRLAKAIVAFTANPSVVLIFSDYFRVNAEGEIIHASTIPPNLAHPPSLAELLDTWWPISPSTVTMTRRAWERSGGFDIGLGAFEDLDLFLRLREHGEFAYIAEPLARFRMNERGPDKWNPDNFLRLARRRYGCRALKLIREIRTVYAGSFVSKALRQMDMGRRREALRCFLKALKYKPSLIAFALNPVRIAHRQNRRRIANMLRPMPSAE